MKTKSEKRKAKSYNLKLKTFTLCAVVLHFALYTLHFAPSVFGQTLSLGLYPPLLEVMIKPGKTITQAFRITNNGDPLILTTHVLPFTPRDELGNIHLQEEVTPPPPQRSWFSLSNADIGLDDSFFLDSGKDKQVVLKIKIPDTAPEGDYYFSLVFTSLPKISRLLGTEAKVKMAANILLTVSKTGQPEKSGQIIELKVPKIVDSFDKIPVTLKVKNTGSAFFKPQGEITLQGPLNLKAKFPILAENVLAGSTRLLRASPSAFLTSSLEPRASSLLLSGFFLGPYKILTSFSLYQNTTFLHQEASFWAFPFKLTLAFFVLVAFLFLIRKKFKEES